uniref:Uncharacterized protein n=1 Tax=Ackermannviridae sp. TaxID=2831612 RepID=A0A8S5VKE4_9CAUD|nr:MAG TPA: hypothetical protein [Ackermannviridae sp.]
MPNGEHNCRVRPCYLYPYHRRWSYTQVLHPHALARFGWLYSK